MLDDMRMRKLNPKTQSAYIRKKLWVEVYSCAARHCLESGLNLLDTVALLINVKGWSMTTRSWVCCAARLEL